MTQRMTGVALTVQHNKAARDLVPPGGLEEPSQTAQAVIQLVDGNGLQVPHDQSWRTIFGKTVHTPGEIVEILQGTPALRDYRVTTEERQDTLVGINLEYSPVELRQ